VNSFTVPASTGRGSSVGGRIFATLFFLVFGGMGLFFTVWLSMQVYRDAQTYRWPAVPCVILESGVTDKGGNSPYAVHVHYQYGWSGSTHSSQQLATQTKSFSDYSKAQLLVDKFRADTEGICYVNPRNPSDAVLHRTPLWSGFFLFLPLAFFGIGAGGLYLTWRKSTRPILAESMATRPKATAGHRFSFGFFSIFLLVGLVAFYFLVVGPLIKTIQARAWNPVPCTVISSRVQSHNSDDGTTYKVDILYSYQIDGREYRANRYQFLGGSSSGRRGKQRIVDQHPPGAKKVCYVNPRDPTDAVLYRGLSSFMWFGFIPLVFVAVGFGGIIGTLRQAKSQMTPITVMRPPGGLLLKPKSSPVTKFVGGLLVSIFWNGITWVGLLFVIQDKAWFALLFLSLFVLIGLALIWFTIHSFFGLFSPRAHLRLSHTPVALGESGELSWEFTGRIDKLRDLHLVIEGRDERDEGSGKNRRTHTNTFYTADIGHFTNINDLKSASVLCTIPTGHLPTDTEGGERVIWLIRLKATVEFGADLNDEYPLTVVAPVPSGIPSSS
jgi:Protein of unknown function (DUF3592)